MRDERCESSEVVARPARRRCVLVFRSGQATLVGDECVARGRVARCGREYTVYFFNGVVSGCAVFA